MKSYQCLKIFQNAKVIALFANAPPMKDALQLFIFFALTFCINFPMEISFPKLHIWSHSIKIVRQWIVYWKIIFLSQSQVNYTMDAFEHTMMLRIMVCMHQCMINFHTMRLLLLFAHWHIPLQNACEVASERRHCNRVK